MIPRVVLRTAGHAGFQQQVKSKDTSSRAQTCSALACRKSGVCLGMSPPPVLAGIFLHSRHSQGSGPITSSLSATKPGSKATAILIYLTGPGSTWGWHKSCAAVPVWLAETSKRGTGGTSWVPSDAPSVLPHSPCLPTDQSKTTWQGLLSLRSSSPRPRHCNTSVPLLAGKPQYTT